MCIVAAKYFPDVGWVGVKNRDRNYVPELEFDLLTTSTPHRLVMRDQMTGFMEGLNLPGICVLSASLQVLDDEKEVKKRTTDDNPDGERIEAALKHTTIKQVVDQLIKTKITGNTLVFDQKECYLIEGCNLDDEYYYEVERVKDSIARTNHGVLLEWAGYQNGVNHQQDLSRKSSESRLRYAESALEQAQTPDELIDLLAQTPEKDTQMNPLRTTTDRKKMRTTAQEMMIPKEHTFYLRPIQSKLDIDFWAINQNPDDLWVEILSNRTLKHPTEPDIVVEEETDPYKTLAKQYGNIKPVKPGLDAVWKKYANISR